MGQWVQFALLVVRGGYEEWGSRICLRSLLFKLAISDAIYSRFSLFSPIGFGFFMLLLICFLFCGLWVWIWTDLFDWRLWLLLWELNWRICDLLCLKDLVWLQKFLLWFAWRIYVGLKLWVCYCGEGSVGLLLWVFHNHCEPLLLFCNCNWWAGVEKLCAGFGK